MKVNGSAEKGHIARECPRPRKKAGRPEVTKWKRRSNCSGNESRPSGEWQPTDGPVYSAGCVGRIANSSS
jgi:hypothetical protein